MSTKAERDAMEFWCEEHDRWFVGRQGCDVKRLEKALDNLWERRWGPLQTAPGTVTIGGAYAQDIADEYCRLGAKDADTD